MARARLGDACLWHKADILNALTNVRFWGNNGHDADMTRCLLLTQSGRSNLARLKSRAASSARLLATAEDALSKGGRRADEKEPRPGEEEGGAGA